MTTDRRHKSVMTKISEVVIMLIGLGVFGLFIQIGEYKANFKTLCEKVSELKITIDANAEENNRVHLYIRKDVEITKQAVAAHTGKPVQ